MMNLTPPQNNVVPEKGRNWKKYKKLEYNLNHGSEIDSNKINYFNFVVGALNHRDEPLTDKLAYLILQAYHAGIRSNVYLSTVCDQGSFVRQRFSA